MHVEKYGSAAVGHMLEHYERLPETRRGFRRENVDPERTALNYNLGPGRVGLTQADFVRARVESLNLRRRPRKDAVLFCDCVLTLPRTFPAGRQREFFEDAYAFLAARYGADNVVSAWVHMDEAQPHMHFCWVPVTRDGRLSAKDVLSRADLRGLHGDLKAWLEPRLGVPCDVLLPDEQRAQKELSRLPQEDYKASVAEIEATQERLEGVRRAEAAAEAAGRGALGTVAELVRGGTGVAGVREAEEEEGRLGAEVEELERAVRDAERRAEEQTRELRELGERVARAEGEVRAQGARLGRLEGLLERAVALVREALGRAGAAFFRWYAAPSPRAAALAGSWAAAGAMAGPGAEAAGNGAQAASQAAWWASGDGAGNAAWDDEGQGQDSFGASVAAARWAARRGSSSGRGL